ncbi:MAG: dihydroneopterin aldolase [Bacteroidota bacterium]
MGVIAIEGIELYGYHGVYPVEHQVGNLYRVDVYLTADISRPAETDALEDTIDYQSIYEMICAAMQIKTHLLERMVGRIGTQILSDFSQIESVKVRVTKIKPLAMDKCGQTFVEETFR